MKCMILAGGSGDSLWPLSRKNYPKQFMNIKEGRSMLQETVVRNMPFCDEFIIVTNESYRNIVNGQMKVFQSLKYRIICEGEPKGTAAAIMLGSMFCNQSELVFVVTADNIIEGVNYKDAVLRGKELAKAGQITVIGVKPEGEAARYDCLYRDGEEVMQFITRQAVAKDAMASYEKGYLWNSGMFIFRAGDMLNLARIYAPQLFMSCRQAKKRVSAIRRVVRFSANIMRDIPRGSIEHLIFRRVSGTRVVEADINWMDVGDVRDLRDINAVSGDYVIENNCDNVVVLNEASKKLVVANDLKDVVVVNTEDAVFVSSVDKIHDVKGIIKDNKDKYATYFDDNRLSYREWGLHELLNASEGYKVKKVTVYPGMTMNLHQHERRSEHWSVVEGTATITLGKETRDYEKFESVFVPIGTMHKVANKTNKNVVIIEVGIGEDVSESDMVKIYDGSENNDSNYIVTADNPVVKLDPAFKDNLWGGSKLKTVYGKQCEYDIIAESWELSAHPDGQSVIALGNYKGMLFNDYLSIIGKEALGWKCQAQDRFPVLIKFIDAKDALSIQIHPDDEYALENENEYGKNEMWYVMDCEPGAYLYCGLSKEVSKKELQERIANNTITEVLNKIDVKKGDVVMVKAGTIHAIGAGIMICEVQQNSNSTYRMYDYDRRDKYGNLRELHVEKAMDVVDNSVYVKDSSTEVMLEENEHYSSKRLVQCKYFECIKYEVNDEVSIPVDESSFVSVVFIEGQGTIQSDDYDIELEYKAGESFFVRAGKRNIIIKGKGVCIVTHI